jgi:hypothetical protein
MKGLARWLACSYPRQWRARYGQEFDALLEDADVTVLDLVGILRSALEMRMKSITFPRVVDLVCRDIPYGYEVNSSVELPLDDGSLLLVRSFYRQIDLGDSYVTLTHSSRGSEPAQTILICGKKGEVEGDFRTDQTEMLVLRTDGTVQRTEQTVKTWLKYDTIVDRVREKYRLGLSVEDIFRRVDSDNPLWS